MGPRPRNRARRKLPDYLRERRDKRTGKTYYSYVGPDGREYGLGTDKANAVQQAIDANLRRLQSPPKLWDRITGQDTPTVSRLITEYRQALKGAENTRRSAEVYLRRLETLFGSRPVAGVTTRQIHEALREYVDAGKMRAAKACRSRWLQVFAMAERWGWIERGRNPVEVTETGRVEIQRSRLSLEDFFKIRDCAPEPWVTRAMDLALVTAQRREDIARMRFRDASDGYLHVIQGKTGKRLQIPLSLTLRRTGWNIGTVIGWCRDTALSPYLIHHSRPYGNAPAGSRIHVDTISRRFADARNASGIKWRNVPPTFHELRSLSLRLYEAQGVNVRLLAGHSDPRTTAVYTDSRGSEWIRVPEE